MTAMRGLFSIATSATLALIIGASGCDEEPGEGDAHGLAITPLSLASADGAQVDRAVFSAWMDGEPLRGTGYVRIEIVERSNPSTVICRAARRSARNETTEDDAAIFVVTGARFLESCPPAEAPDSRSARFTFYAQAGAEGAEAVGILEDLPPSLGAPR